MPDPDPDQNTKSRVACPECGGDACILQDTRRGWTHRSRVIPRVAWIIFCLGFIGFWIWNGQWDYRTRSSGTKSPPMPVQNGPAYTVLNPFRQSHLAELFVSTRDMQDAINGNEPAIAKVMDKFGEPSKSKLVGSGVGEVESVRFGLKYLYGNMSSAVWYDAGGRLAQYSKNVMVQDVRDPDSVGRNMYQGNYGNGGFRIYPSFQYTKLEHDLASQRVYSINIMTAFGLVGICVIVVRVVSWLCAMLGVSILAQRRFRVALFLMAMLSEIVLVSVFGRQEWRATTSDAHSQGDVAQSDVYATDRLNAAALDPIEAVKICQELLDLLPPNHEGELLLAQEWKFVQSTVRWAAFDWTHLRVMAGPFTTVLTVDHRQFPVVNEGEQISVGPRYSFWNALCRSGTLMLRWGLPEDRWQVGIKVGFLFSVGVFFWLIWSVVHWGARVVFRRIQRRRVLLNQCIFCAYPLTTEAVNARYPVEVS